MGLFAPSLHAVAAKREESGPIFGEWNGSDTASTASAKDLPAGEQKLNAAELVKGNPCLRLEHKLQTAMGAAAWNAAAISLGAHGTARHPFSSNAADTRLAHDVPAVLIPLRALASPTPPWVPYVRKI